MLPENTTDADTENSNLVMVCDKSKISVQKISELRCKLLEIETVIHAEKPKKKVKKYHHDLLDFFDYLRSNNILKGLHEIESVSTDENHTTLTIEENTPTCRLQKSNKLAFCASKINFVWNIILLVGKIVACFFSQSISMISSALDSGVDILSSAISFFTNRKIRKLNVYKHPQGKTRMIPLSIIVISVVMAITSLRVVMETLKRIITKTDLVPEFSIVAVSIVIVTIVSKAILFVCCRRIKTPTADVIAQDSRNDVLTNAAVLLGLYSQSIWEYADCVIALIISGYVFISWVSTGASHLGSLVGKTASPLSLQLYGWVCLLHDPEKILYITTVRAYGFGTRYLLEVDIVLRADMPLKEAHDIGETLQQKLEQLPDIERAFVHLDFEKDHNPCLEHKIGILF